MAAPEFGAKPTRSVRHVPIGRVGQHVGPIAGKMRKRRTRSGLSEAKASTPARDACAVLFRAVPGGGHADCDQQRAALPAKAMAGQGQWWRQAADCRRSALEPTLTATVPCSVDHVPHSLGTSSANIETEDRGYPDIVTNALAKRPLIVSLTPTSRRSKSQTSNSPGWC